jgi:hypothetical protein
LKNLQSANFSEFRKCFLAKLEKIFVVPGNTFDNVKWNFPIWFFIRNWQNQEIFNWISADMFNRNWDFLGNKYIESYDNTKWFIWERYSKYYDKNWTEIWIMNTRWNDFQNQLYIRITSNNNHNHTNIITSNNLIVSSIYLAVRHCIEATRLNDRDQFLRPKDERENDTEFQNDCLAFTLFHWQNRITSRETWINHRIPFTENEVNAREKFASHFMTDFLKGREFSPEAKDVFDAWKKLWTYYHENCSNSDYLANASLYEIREYFQWRNDKWKMNNKSDDEKYMELIWNLREKLRILWDKIAEKVYEYEFLKR